MGEKSLNSFSTLKKPKVELRDDVFRGIIYEKKMKLNASPKTLLNKRFCPYIKKLANK